MRSEVMISKLTPKNIDQIINNLKNHKSKAGSSNPDLQPNDPSLSILNIEAACGDGESVVIVDRDGETSKSKRCSENPESRLRTCQCRICAHFKPTNSFVSTQTHRTFPILNHGNETIDCNSANVIYLMTCSTCHLQYVGETVQTLKNRWCAHRAGMAGSASHADCTRLYEHFSKGLCKDSHFSLQIIEKLSGDGRIVDVGDKQGTGKDGVSVDGVPDKTRKKPKLKPIDKSVESERRKRETYWIKALRTAYPYGLNSRIGEEYKKVNNDIDVIGKYFIKTGGRGIYGSRGKRHARHTHCRLTKFNFTDLLNQTLKNDLPNAPNFIRISITSMKKSHLKAVFAELLEAVRESGEDFQYTHWYLMTCDAIETKIFKSKPQVLKPKAFSKYQLNICFEDKAFDFINLQEILNSKVSKENKPPLMKEEDLPRVVYSLTDPVRSKILNYSKFVDELKLDEFVKDNNSITCPCSMFDDRFVNDHHKHIITGDLSLIKNKQLRGVYEKGPKFREPKIIDFDKSKKLINSALNKFIDKIKDDLVKDDVGVDSLYFLDWKMCILGEVENKIKKIYENNFRVKTATSVFTNREVKKELDFLLNNFVTVPIDKAQNNIAFICKQFYASVLAKELNSTTYCKVTETNIENIVNNHSNFLYSQKIKLNDEFKKLPRIYWTPKMHKNPVGSRFIIGNPQSSLKPLTKDVTSICKLLFQLITAWNDKVKYCTGVNHVWIVQNSNKLVEYMERINQRGKAKSVATYDFSSLYTHIPHDKLLSVLEEIVDFGFNGGKGKYISVTKQGANFVRNQKNSNNAHNYTKDSVKESIKFILENCHFTVGDSIFRQIIGIPMGSDPAPFFANFFLYHYESKWITDLKKKDPWKARKFRNINRYIDDLITPNDDNEFSKSFLQIYPPELKLNKENSSDDAATFLDMDIKIIDNKFVTKLYDKRDSYVFEIVRLPHKCSNIPSKMFYNTIGAETLRICRATTDYASFKLSTHCLLERMVKQGACFNNIKSILDKTIQQHWQVFSKYNKNMSDLKLDLLQSEQL